MTRVLMVCVGNVCRSPLAERLLAARATERGLGLHVSSAGVDALVGDPMDPSAAAEAVQRGAVADGFVARQLTPEMVAEADLVLAATKDVRARVLGIAPAGMRRTFTMLEFAALCALPDLATTAPADLPAAAARLRGRAASLESDVPDPFRRDASVHHAVAEQVASALETIAQRLTGS